MPCLLGCLALAFPRLVIVLLAVFTTYLGRAYDHFIFPLLGFFLLPYTTLAYALTINEHGSVEGLWIVLIVVAVLADLGSYGGGERSVRGYRRR
jgi:hypothetical protein